METLTEVFKRTWLISIIGFILSIAGIWVIFSNEGRAIRIAHALDEALNAAVTIHNEAQISQWEHEGSLVHISGPLQIGEPLTEPDYGIEVLSAKLKRRVQMYQWYEEIVEQSFDDTVASQTQTVYNYETAWKDTLINSDDFWIRSSHTNPKYFPLNSHVHVSENVKIGPLALGRDVKNLFNQFTEITSDERPERQDIKLHSGMYYHCRDVLNPDVGDIRVQFSYAGLEGDVYTVVGQQVKGEIRAFHTTQEHDVLLLFKGNYSLEQTFQAEHFEWRLYTWGFRAGGWFLLFLSATCLAKQIKIILSSYPFVKNLVAPESPFATNLAFSISLALLLTSVAWIWYRPMLGASLAAAAASPFLYCTMTVYNAAQENAYHRL